MELRGQVRSAMELRNEEGQGLAGYGKLHLVGVLYLL